MKEMKALCLAWLNNDLLATLITGITFVTADFYELKFDALQGSTNGNSTWTALEKAISRF